MQNTEWPFFMVHPLFIYLWFVFLLLIFGKILKREFCFVSDEQISSISFGCDVKTILLEFSKRLRSICLEQKKFRKNINKFDLFVMLVNRFPMFSKPKRNL